MPPLHIFQRSDPSTDSSTLTTHNPITIAGVTAIVLAVFGVCLWLGFRMYGQHTAAKRESKMGATFLSVKGLVQDNGSGNEKDGTFTQSKTPTNGFSRQMIGSTVVLPEKAAINPGQSPIPKSFAPMPVSFLPSSGHRHPPLDFSAPRESPHSRSSFGSFGSSHNRFSVISGTSTQDTPGMTRKIRQIFDPILPDELLPSLGEQLTVVQSFDDGWCVVGRENSTFVHTAKSLFRSSPDPGQNVELGVVPAWCFLKPVKGLRAERPIRSTSLGVTVNMDGPGISSRNELVSWSNF